LKWSRTPDDLPRLAALELAILERAAGAVAPGGLLVYATCSSEPDENAAVVDRFLSTHPHFARTGAPVGARAVDMAAVLDGTGDMVTRPFDHDLDAFYAAFLVHQ
jgi:16S rRNA (cytosine967-C5)-methyltransferase